MRRFVNFAIGLALTFFLAASSPALATAPDAGKFGFGIFGGMYKPSPDLFDDSSVVGLRFGAMLTERVAVSASLGFLSLESEDEVLEDAGLMGKIEADVTLLDLNAWYIFAPQKRISFTVGAGIGGSFSSVDADLTGPDGRRLWAEEIAEDSFTANVGFGPLIGLTDKLVLRLLPQVRWYEVREDDKTDFQTTIMLGWVFGN